MKRLRRGADNGCDPPTSSDPGDQSGGGGVALRDSSRRLGHRSMKAMGVFVVCLMVFSVLFSVSMVLKDPPPDTVSKYGEAASFRFAAGKDFGDDSFKSAKAPKDKLHGGLLADGFGENSCLSRYQSVLYCKEGLYIPSSYLISRLRSYEALHKRCGPYTEPYNKTVEQLRSGQHIEPSDCSYVVWVSFSGLGNRILSLASTFLFAILTNRVILVDPGADMKDLFCEPFPEVSWFLPMDFPLKDQLDSFDQKSPYSYGRLLKNDSVINRNQMRPPSYLYLHLAHDYDDHDKLFFCEEDQSFFQKVPWLILKTNNYFVPSLFLIPTYEKELSNIFPNKETVFHFLGRYLYHPTNAVWGLITRYYHAYLAKADERIGIQIRVFENDPGPFQHVLDQILACTMQENLLPRIDPEEANVSPGIRKSKALLMTSLSAGYFEKIRDMYWEHSTTTGEVIGVYQPSHEVYQQTEKQNHNRKAWAEMYLLSLSDVLVTSAWSTFGYVAQGLGGLKPWILYKPENRTAPNPPCIKAMSMEPCFHAPPFFDCKSRKGTDTGALVPHVRHCEDMSWGLKVIDH